MVLPTSFSWLILLNNIYSCCQILFLMYYYTDVKCFYIMSKFVALKFVSILVLEMLTRLRNYTQWCLFGDAFTNFRILCEKDFKLNFGTLVLFEITLKLLLFLLLLIWSITMRKFQNSPKMQVEITDTTFIFIFKLLLILFHFFNKRLWYRILITNKWQA